MKPRLLAAAVAAALLMTSCGGGGETSAPPLADSVHVVYDTAKAERGDVEAVLVYSAYVLPVQTDVSFEDSSGVVDRVFVKTGDSVSEGDALLRLDTEGLRERLDDAKERLVSLEESGARERRMVEIDLELAKLDLEEAEETDPGGLDASLLRLEVESRQSDLDRYDGQLERSLDAAKKDIAELEKEIESATLRAPVSGEVISVYTSEGARAASSTTLVTLSDGDRRYISCAAGEKVPSTAQLSYIEDETEYPLERWEYTDREIAVFEATGRDAPQRFVRSDGGELPETGEFVQLRAVRESAKDTVRIPSGALYRDSGVTYVYIEDGGELVYTEVKAGVTNDAYVEILDGVEEGDEVYVGG